MNAMFAAPLQAGELGFLAHRVLNIFVSDAELRFSVSFRRQLKTSGDTELGLYVKNLLDGLELESLPYHRAIAPLLRSSLAVADGVDRIRHRLSNLRLP
jgi:predicted lipid carrier protein YhbT